MNYLTKPSKYIKNQFIIIMNAIANALFHSAIYSALRSISYSTVRGCSTALSYATRPHHAPTAVAAWEGTSSINPLSIYNNNYFVKKKGRKFIKMFVQTDGGGGGRGGEKKWSEIFGNRKKSYYIILITHFFNWEEENY